MLDTASLVELLEQPKKIVITTHHKPDGDAMGSSLGLYNYLIQRGHHAQVITPTDYPDYFNWMPGNDQVIIYTEKEQESAALIAEADMIFCLDFNTLSRINQMGELVAKSDAVKVLIDHHLEPQDFDDYRHWDTTACATAQLVYTFIARILQDKKLVNKDVATCLYAGILTDSASFHLPNTTSEVHRIAADLIDAGAVNWQIYDLIYNNSAENRLYNTAIIAVNKQDLDRYDIKTGETEGIVNYALSIAGIRLAAFIVERTGQIKLSLRSVGDVPANEMCRQYFNGGGHFNAAGGHSSASLQEVVNQFKSILPEYKKLLIN
jgi:phosphoesterase RecJ-like protein